MAHHYPDLGIASDWLKQICHTAQPIRSTTQIWLVTQHVISMEFLTFCGETKVVEVAVYSNLTSHHENFCSTVSIGGSGIKKSGKK